MSIYHQILRQLIDNLEIYEQQEPKSASLHDFLNWVLQNDLPGTPYQFDRFENIDVAISKELVILSRFARFHLKRAFGDGLIQTADELGYLATLLSGEPYTKIGLIEANIHEKTSGMEIIKRLIGLKLIEQSEDPDDRRSKRLKITELGRVEAIKQFQLLAPTMTLIAGNLSPYEKQILLSLINKLNIHHKEIFENLKNL
jgi:DNA-binding MarR family transcriptional regulator